MAMPTMYSPVLSSWSGPLTLFAPFNDSLHSCPSCFPLRLFREHLVPGFFSLPYLSKLAFGTKLEITSPDRSLIITSSSAAIALYPGLIANSSDIKIFVDGVEVTHPDLFNNGHFMIHGIGGFIAPLSPFSCSHGDPQPGFAPELAIASASALPRSAIIWLMLRYIVSAFPCTLAIATYPDTTACRRRRLPSHRMPRPSLGGTVGREEHTDPPSIPSLPRLPLTL